MIWELLRTNKVDVMRYLPKFLANDGTFKATQDSLSTEHEKQRLAVIDITRQFFVETATWGLDDWERIYNIVPSNRNDLKARRKALLDKIRGAATVTNTRMQALIDNIVPTKDAHLVENVAPGTFRIDMETMVAVDELRAMVNFYKPAHLTCIISHYFYAPPNSMHVAMGISEFEDIFIEFPKNDDIDAQVGAIHYGGGISISESMEVH